MTQLHNNRLLKEKRKYLRNNATKAEKELWNLLKGAALDGRKFRRQHSFGGYIPDFYCPSERLCIELDGEDHFTEQGKKHDEKRSQFLNDNFIKVIRFESGLIFHAPEEILFTIKTNFKSEFRNLPSSFRGGPGVVDEYMQ